MTGLWWVTLPSGVGIFGSAIHISGGAPSDGYVSMNTSTSNTSTYTFTSQAIGTAASDRRVIVGAAGRDITATPTSVTVGGTALTLDVGEANQPISYIYSEVIPTGTNADIVITLPSGNTFCAIAVWVVYGKSPVAVADQTTNSANPVADLTTVAGDFCVTIWSFRTTSAAGNQVTFTNGSMNKRFDLAVDTATRQAAAGDVIATGTTTSMGGSIANYNAESVAVAAAYR